MTTPSKRQKRDLRTMMDNTMRTIARLHAQPDVGADWVFHQTIRFIFDGYPHHAGSLMRQLESVEGESDRVRGLRLILQSEARRPTPFANLCPIPRRHGTP
jgi:hypothetical protein